MSIKWETLLLCIVTHFVFLALWSQFEKDSVTQIKKKHAVLLKQITHMSQFEFET